MVWGVYNERDVLNQLSTLNHEKTKDGSGFQGVKELTLALLAGPPATSNPSFKKLIAYDASVDRASDEQIVERFAESIRIKHEDNLDDCRLLLIAFHNLAIKAADSDNMGHLVYPFTYHNAIEGLKGAIPDDLRHPDELLDLFTVRRGIWLVHTMMLFLNKLHVCKTSDSSETAENTRRLLRISKNLVDDSEYMPCPHDICFFFTEFNLIANDTTNQASNLFTSIVRKLKLDFPLIGEAAKTGSNGACVNYMRVLAIQMDSAMAHVQDIAEWASSSKKGPHPIIDRANSWLKLHPEHKHAFSKASQSFQDDYNLDEAATVFASTVIRAVCKNLPRDAALSLHAACYNPERPEKTANVMAAVAAGQEQAQSSDKKTMVTDPLDKQFLDNRLGPVQPMIDEDGKEWPDWMSYVPSRFYNLVGVDDRRLLEEARKRIPAAHPFHEKLEKYNGPQTILIPEVCVALKAFGDYIPNLLAEVILEKNWLRLKLFDFEPITRKGIVWKPWIKSSPDAIRCIPVPQFTIGLSSGCTNKELPPVPVHQRAFLEECMIVGAQFEDQVQHKEVLKHAIERDLLLQAAAVANNAMLTLEHEEETLHAEKQYRESEEYKRIQLEKNQRARANEKATKAAKATAAAQKEAERVHTAEAKRLQLQQAEADAQLDNGIKYGEQLWDTGDRKAARKRLATANQKHSGKASDAAKERAKLKKDEWQRIEADERAGQRVHEPVDETPVVVVDSPPDRVRETQSQRKTRRKREKEEALQAQAQIDEKRLVIERADADARRIVQEQHVVLDTIQCAPDTVSKTESESDNTCIVCMERDRTHTTVPCGHLRFCGECVAMLLRKGQDTCPECREPLASIKFMQCFS